MNGVYEVYKLFQNDPNLKLYFYQKGWQSNAYEKLMLPSNFEQDLPKRLKFMNFMNIYGLQAICITTRLL